MLQPKISEENLKLRVEDRNKEIPLADNEDGTFNLNGFRFKPGEYDRYGSWFTFMYDSEWHVRMYWCHRFMSTNARLLDIGAFCGAWTLPALVLGASVVSVEPDPNFYKILENNVRLNNFDRWKGYNNGVYDSNFVGDVYDMENVNFITLDDLIDDKPFTYVKIDVEGAELEVLKGGREFIKKYHPNMLIEIHEGTTIDSIYKELVEEDYQLTVIPYIPHIFAGRPAKLEGIKS